MKTIITLFLLAAPAFCQFTNAKSIWSKPIDNSALADGYVLTYDAAHAKYIWAAAGSGSGGWSRTGTTLSPTTAGDDVYLNGGALLTNAEYSNGTCTTAKTIDPVNGNRQKVTLTNAQACALTFTQPASGTVSIQLKVIQSAAGSFNGTITGGLWSGGTVPTITATSGAVDIVTCYLDGTSAYCAATQDFR